MASPRKACKHPSANGSRRRRSRHCWRGAIACVRRSRSLSRPTAPATYSFRVTFRTRLALTSAALAIAVQAGLAQQNARIVAIADIHGAYGPFVAILTKAGLIDAQQKWTGGRTTL